MNINNQIESSLKLKISDWELDFYSRPIIESNGKKRWELIICSTINYKTEDIFPVSYTHLTLPTITEV